MSEIGDAKITVKWKNEEWHADVIVELECEMYGQDSDGNRGRWLEWLVLDSIVQVENSETGEVYYDDDVPEALACLISDNINDAELEC